MSGGEEAFVAWLRRRLPGPPAIGDDTAELTAPGGQGRLVVTVDQQVEGTHYLSGLDPRAVGRRLVAVNLSDLAASGARPRWALLALAAPPELDPRRIVDGALAEAKPHGLRLVGGDFAHAPLLAASLTAIGERGKGDATLGRDRAKPGHRIWLGGTVGDSALGCELLLRGAISDGRRVDLSAGPEGVPALDELLPRRLLPAARRAVRRNLRPTPQLALGHWLAGLGAKRAGAAIDVSDGLAKDLGRVLEASGVGAELDLRLLHEATAPRFDALATALELDPVAVALAGGEDYVLLFTLPGSIEPPPRFGCLPVGRILPGRRAWMLDRDGKRHPLPRLGWDHLEEES